MKETGNIFYISDTHFSHEKMLSFLRADGTKVRPEFSSVEEMNETIVENWNSVVKPKDKVYHLGDVCMKRSHINIVSRLNGRKRLILGNHDIFGFEFYKNYFEEVYAMRIMREYGVMMTHIPIHLDSIKKGCINVHGHIHEKVIAEDSQMVLGKLDDQHPFYFNVSVEHNNYTPVPYETVRLRLEKNKEFSYMLHS